MFENAGEGDDLAVAFANFTLGAGQSVETLSAAEGSGRDQPHRQCAGPEHLRQCRGQCADQRRRRGLHGRRRPATTCSCWPTAGGVATIGDYAAGRRRRHRPDPVRRGRHQRDRRRLCPDTAGGQLQVDANGGGDAIRHPRQRRGAGAVTIRYLSGGAPTDLSVARSAGQTEAVVAKVALDDGPAHASLLDGWHAGALHDSPGLDPIAPHFDLHGII